MTLNIKQQLGTQIKRLRQAKGLTQEELAEAIGIAPRTLCFIENGHNFLTSETLEKIISTLNISPEELFAISHNKPIEDLRNEIIQIVSSLSDRTQIETLYKITKSLIK